MVGMKQAYQDELKSLTKIKTWEYSLLPKRKNVIGCRRVFKCKTNEDGCVIGHKARLVAKG